MWHGFHDRRTHDIVDCDDEGKNTITKVCNVTTLYKKYTVLSSASIFCILYYRRRLLLVFVFHNSRHHSGGAYLFHEIGWWRSRLRYVTVTHYQQEALDNLGVVSLSH